jgi:hypothetical protein
MKQTFSNQELPHVWAQQSQNYGKNPGGSFYFRGATIYSYGNHFPIATIEENTVLFTKSSYSNTTAKHINKARQSVSHKDFIYCYEVPVKYNDDKPLAKQELFSTHEKNINRWKGEIETLFLELGNKKNRDITGRTNGVSVLIGELNAYVSYFKLKIKDSELKSMLKIASSPDFLDKAREAKEKQDAVTEKKVKEAAKAYEIYIALWREGNTEGIKALTEKTKDLCNYYLRNTNSFTRLRYNAQENRLETSKGIQIPAQIAKRAYTQLNGCMEGSCQDISVPVLNYTITETGEDYIKAGCHTIPKDDVRYIANLLGW